MQLSAICSVVVTESFNSPVLYVVCITPMHCFMLDACCNTSQVSCYRLFCLPFCDKIAIRIMRARGQANEENNANIDP